MTIPDITRLEVQMPAMGTFVEYTTGRICDAAEIKHTAYIYQGRFFRYSTVFDSIGRNTDVPSDSDQWPHPGLWFDELADQIRATTQAVAS